MRGRARGRVPLRWVSRTTRAAAYLVALAWGVVRLFAIEPPRALAQEFDPSQGAVSDTIFAEQPRAPIEYISSYTHDQARGGWTQSLEYGRSFKVLALSLTGASNTSEDVLKYGSRSTNGDLSGRLDWRAVQHLILSMDGHFSMSSIADGSRASKSEQRRNSLSFQGQYNVSLYKGASMMLGGSSEFQRNYDHRNGTTTLLGDTVSPDTLRAQRDSFYTSSRLDGVRAQVLLPAMRGLTFDGKMFGNHARPTFTRYRDVTFQALGSASVFDTLAGKPDTTVSTSTVFFDGALTLDRFRATKITLRSRRSNVDQAYADLSQLQIETSTSEGQLYSVNVESSVIPHFVLTSNAALNRSLRQYVARPNLNALITAREVSAGVGYNTPATMAFVNMTVNRTRAERQATQNGVTISRLLTTNVQQRLSRHIWLVGLGTASLYSYQYLFPPDTTGRSFSKDDRDLASAFGSIGVRFGITPHCSTAVNFSVNRAHNVSIDRSRSSGNIATTVYQLNGSLRFPLSRDLSIGQDYVATATYRAYDFDDEKDDLSRNFRIETSIADTLFPFAYIRLDHRYYFFDNGEFTPIGSGGPRFYGVAVEQAQQTLEGSIGVRPVSGITFLIKQSLSDTENRNLITETHQGTEQWNLSLGIEVNRSFWDGAQLMGAIRREERYQNQSTLLGSTGKEGHWLAGITFQKEF